MRDVEFLPEWYPKVRQRKRMVVMQAWATLALMCALGLWFLLAQRNAHAREVELASLHTDLNQSETELQRLQNLLELQQQLGRQDQIFAKIGRPVESTKILTTLEQLMPRDMALLSLTLETEDVPPPKPAGGIAARAQQQRDAKNGASAGERLRIRMMGVAPTDIDVGEFIAKLTAKPFLKQPELIHLRERQESGHVMREFEISLVMDLSGIGVR